MSTFEHGDVNAQPGRPRPLARTMWHERRVSWIEHRRLRLQLPVIGWFTAPAFGYHVGVELTRLWTPLGRLCDVAVEGVAAHCSEREGERCLTLLVTFASPPRQARRIDGVAMARDVAAAVVVAVDEACREEGSRHGAPTLIDLSAEQAAALPWPRRPL